MSIEEKEFIKEKNKLSEVRNWVRTQLEEKEKNKIQLEQKVSELKKGSGGTYSTELEINKKLLDVESRNFNNYREAQENPYFARIDFKEKLRSEETMYIGKFGLDDRAKGEEIVIDWRAPVAELYYSGTKGDANYKSPMGIIEGEMLLKRRFLIGEETLIDAFDEGINEIMIKGQESSGESLVDEFLKVNLQESASGKLKDVVATIQKEQNYVIRLNRDETVIIQGSAGSGKTTVALHRLAYLIYRYKDSMSSEDILVIAPNRIFLDYISEILPNLGVNQVKQCTFEELALETLNIKGKVYSKEDKLAKILESKDETEIKNLTNSSKIKGTMGFKRIMDFYIKYIEVNDEYIDDIKVLDYTLFTKMDIKKLYLRDLIHLPMNKRKSEIGRYFKARIKNKLPLTFQKIDSDYIKIIDEVKNNYEGDEKRRRIIEAYDKRDEIKKEIKKQSSKVIERYIKKWICEDAKSLYVKLFNDEELFNKITNRTIPKELYLYMRDEFNTNLNNNRIDSDDLVSMMYLKLKMDGISEQYKQIVVDEAQDYSLFQYHIIREISSNKGLTIVGDLGQGIYYYRGIDNWGKLSEKVFENKDNYIQLTQSYRSTVEIINFAGKVLSKQKANLKGATPILRHGDEPEVIELNEYDEFQNKVDKIVQHISNQGKKTVAIICRTYEECKRAEKLLENSNYNWELVNNTNKKIQSDYLIIPSYVTKGLEFDCSIVFDCNEGNYKDTEIDKKLLYVVLTRALHYEYIFYYKNSSCLLE